MIKCTGKFSNIVSVYKNSIQIHKINRIIIAEGVWADAVVLFRKRVWCHPSVQRRMVLACAIKLAPVSLPPLNPHFPKSKSCRTKLSAVCKIGIIYESCSVRLDVSDNIPPGEIANLIDSNPHSIKTLQHRHREFMGGLKKGVL